MDVAVACFTSSEVVVMLGDGGGGFSTPDSYNLLPAAASPYWILSGDFDDDGVADLVTSDTGSFSVLRGRGDGTFGPPVSTTEVGTFFGADAADFNGDGRLDLAFANFGQDEITIYLNTTAPTTVPLLTPIFLLALAGLLGIVGASLETMRGERVGGWTSSESLKLPSAGS
jgi:hypothetical protein